MREAPVLIVDDDSDVRHSLRALLESAGFEVNDYDSANGILADKAISAAACVIADIRMPGMDGLELQEELNRRGIGLPVIIVTGHGDVPLAVRAMKAGAIDFIEKPFHGELILESVRRAIDHARENRSHAELAKQVQVRVAALTERERQVLQQLVAGHANKVIAYKLDISSRTVEIHRAHLMEKMQAKSLSELVRMALAVSISPAADD